MSSNENEKDGLSNLIGYAVMTLGTVGSLFLGNVFKALSVSSGGYVDYTYNWMLAIYGTIVSLLFGFIFLLIGEILYLCYVNKMQVSLMRDEIKKLSEKDESVNETEKMIK